MLLAKDMEIGQKGFLYMGCSSFNFMTGSLYINLKKLSMVSEKNSSVFIYPIERLDDKKYSIEIDDEEFTLGLENRYTEHMPEKQNLKRKIIRNN